MTPSPPPASARSNVALRPDDRRPRAGPPGRITVGQRRCERAMRSNIAVLTSATDPGRDLVKRREPGQLQRRLATSISNATLIRSGGWFLTSAASRIASSATARARAEDRHHAQAARAPAAAANFAVARPAAPRAVPVRQAPGSRAYVRSTTSAGTSLARRGKYPRRWKAPQRQHQREQVLIGASRAACAHATSISVGVRLNAQLPGASRRRPKARIRRPLDRSHRTTSLTRRRG